MTDTPFGLCEHTDTPGPVSLPLLGGVAAGCMRSRCWTPAGTCHQWVREEHTCAETPQCAVAVLFSMRPLVPTHSHAHLHHHTHSHTHSTTTKTGGSAAGEFAAERIQGAQFWDIDGVCDPASSLPHMLPSEQAFAAAADALGISNDDAVVVYDGMGLFAAPRAWWTWRVFGHDRCVCGGGGGGGGEWLVATRGVRLSKHALEQ